MLSMWSWTTRNSQSSVCTRKFVIFFYEYFVDFWGFWFLWILTICSHQVSWPTSSLTLQRSLWIFHLTFSSKLIDSWLVFRVNWYVLNQCSEGNWWSITCLTISFLEWCLATAQSTMHLCDCCSFSHSADGSFCHSVRFSGMRGSCVMIPLHILTSSNKLFGKCLCNYYPLLWRKKKYW